MVYVVFKNFLDWNVVAAVDRLDDKTTNVFYSLLELPTSLVVQPSPNLGSPINLYNQENYITKVNKTALEKKSF